MPYRRSLLLLLNICSCGYRVINFQGEPLILRISPFVVQPLASLETGEDGWLSVSPDRTFPKELTQSSLDISRLLNVHQPGVLCRGHKIIGELMSPKTEGAQSLHVKTTLYRRVAVHELRIQTQIQILALPRIC